MTIEPLDPFELPDWLGTSQVIWYSDEANRLGHHVHGRLTTDGDEHPCDLLAVDQAFPDAVVTEDVRRLAHQAWRNGEVLLLSCDGRATLATPGTCFSAERMLDVLGRLARAVGAKPDRFVAALRVGVARRDG